MRVVAGKTYNGNTSVDLLRVYYNYNKDVDVSDEQWIPSDSGNKDDKDYNRENRQNTHTDAGNPEVLLVLTRRPCLVLASVVILLAIATLVSAMFAIGTFYQNGSTDIRCPIIPSNDSEIFYNGLQVMKRNGWFAQPPIPNINKLHTPVPRVIITHTASNSCHTTPECMIAVHDLQLFHIEEKSWSDIGYNFLVGGDGVAYIGRGWDAVGAHTTTYNNISIGIAFIGTFVQFKPPDVQIEAAKKLIEVGVHYNKISKTYILNAHCQLYETASPGYFLYEDMKTWGHLETGITAFTCKNNFPNFTETLRS